jgi:hypothetical protein
MMHCFRTARVRAPRLVQRLQLSKVTSPTVDPSSFGPVDDTGVIIDAGETTTRTEEPSLMEVKVCFEAIGPFRAFSYTNH